MELFEYSGRKIRDRKWAQTRKALETMCWAFVPGVLFLPLFAEIPLSIALLISSSLLGFQLYRLSQQDIY